MGLEIGSANCGYLIDVLYFDVDVGRYDNAVFLPSFLVSPLLVKPFKFVARMHMLYEGVGGFSVWTGHGEAGHAILVPLSQGVVKLNRWGIRIRTVVPTGH